MLVIPGDLAELSAAHAGQATQRSRFLFRVIQTFGDRLKTGVSCSCDQLARIAGLNADQIRRVLSNLHQNKCLNWTAPFSGRSITLLHPEDEELNIDVSDIARKREMEFRRLDEVIGYTRTRKCRQDYLISYFGEEVGDWRCRNCDNCGAAAGSGSGPRELTEAEENAVRTILHTVDALSGRLGRGTLSLILAGARRPELVERGLDRNPFFGKLKALKQNNILACMKALEDAGCLERVGNPEYPCLDLTCFGGNILRGVEKVKLSLPEMDLPSPRRSAKSRPEPPVRTASSSPGELGLYERLRLLRARMAEKRQVPVYCILSNDALAGLAESKPATAEEALEIRGIGMAKLTTIIPPFLKEIAGWQAENE